MANYFLCLTIFRIALPIILSICVLFRPSGLSALYLLLLYYLPFVPVPTRNQMSGHTGRYLIVLIVVSVLASLCQFAFQIVLLVMQPYGHFLKNCEFLEKLLRHIGFVRLDDISPISGLTWLSPEILLLLTSITFYFSLKKIVVSKRNVEDKEGGSKKKKRKHAYIPFFTNVGRYVVLFAFCLAAVLRPSVVGGLYFLIFLTSATCWACCVKLQKGFAILLRCLIPVVLLHLSALYAYQFQWCQELLAPDSPYPRYFGLTPIFSEDCTADPRDIIWMNNEWATYVNPLALYWLFYLLVLESRGLMRPESQKKQGPFSRLEGSFTGQLSRQMSQRLSRQTLMRSSATKNRWQSATRKVRGVNDTSSVIGERTPLIRGVSPNSKSMRRYSDRNRPGIFQDSTGSVTVTGEPENIPMSPLGKGTTEDGYSPTVFDNILFVFESILQVIIKASYVATNIIMMTWSITYLSWITFVLLIWANIIWLMPQQRKSMLRSSPFLVLYAWFLLLSAYIYSMNLTEDELPSKIQNLNLSQIGFQKVTILPCNPLLVKCFYTVFFWISLRQYVHEKMEQRQSNALADMVAPLQVTVGTAAGVSEEQTKSNKLLNNIGNHIKHFLTKFWIWVVAITLFAVAITGDRMTGFRIIYMALFLFFILTFQLSFRLWRRIMFGFWLTVIIFSMIILVMVYTYQFDNFPEYWSTYLHVPLEQQADIGLELFPTKLLFVRLFTPTFFVIITVIQLHYFHKDFMAFSDPKNASTSIDDGSSVQEGAGKSSVRDDVTSVKYDLSEIGQMTTVQIQKILENILEKLHYTMNLSYLFLEIHMPKIILLFAMLLSIYDKCALYLVVVILISLSCVFGRPVFSFSIYISSVLISLLLLARMIYQIQYIHPEIWDLNCTTTEGNETVTNIVNNALWLGFNKTSEENSLPSLVKWNIIYILVITVFAVVQIRQSHYRMSRMRPTRRAFFMFPRITRNEADQDLSSCIKYLFNYAFYKFGVELSLMATVALIGFRMDMYAIIYSIWLCILVPMNRLMLSKVWYVYLIFAAVLLPIQYIMAVGLPPSLCIDYPWDSSPLLRRLQDWAYLFDLYHPPSVKKLLCDFIVLLFVSRQALVFRIERRYPEAYPGGSNESIIHHAEERNFENPVPDFITYVKSYLDIFKQGFLLGFLWFTLAIVFLAGTNRVNVFSIGYLIGAFAFLWQGTDIYLRPIPKILKAWNWLLGFNVAVITLKAIFQLLGCVFIEEISFSCWTVQLFGVSCVKKFGSITKEVGIEDPDTCQVPREYVGMVWDGLCFGFLIVQRRIFNSYNFFHIVDETKATTILASRGAELIEELRTKRIHEQEEQERKVLEKIKAKMDRIKATQQRIHTELRDESHVTEHHPPLARLSSVSSCVTATSQQTSPNGYHTPIDDEEPTPLTPRSSLIQPQAPSSPYSAIMTVSLEGYLEPQRMSFSSPPNSELNPRPPSPDDSFPVFSPPPYDAAPPYAEAVSEIPTTVHRQTSLGPPWMQDSLVTPRQSIISYSSRSPFSHHEYSVLTYRPRYRRKPPQTYKQAIRSGDYYMFDDMDDDEKLDLMPIKTEYIPPEDEPPGQTVGKFISDIMKTDVGTAARLRRQSSEPAKGKPSASQISAPLSAPPTVPDSGPKTVTIADEPKPGTSKDDDEDISDLTEPKEQSFGLKILDYLLVAWLFVESLMISVIRFLNTYSKDYRYLVRVLRKEKKILKEKTEYTEGFRLGSAQVWQPAHSYQSLVRQSIWASPTAISGSTFGFNSPSDSYRISFLIEERVASEAQKSESGEKPPVSEDSDTNALATPLPYSSEQERRKASVLTIPKIRILAPSLERGLDSPSTLRESDDNELGIDTEMSSYDQPTIIRLLLAIWHIIMSRSELLCYFVIFVYQIKNATFLSLPLPLMVFLWGTLTLPRPSKTFWVTIIAYTEVMVLIKCMFQFDIIPWNQNINLINDPFYPPRIIGIERQKYYAVWDLLLLLVVFFHRLMLKSMGIWKSTYTPATLLSDGEYKYEDGQLKAIELSPPGTPIKEEASDMEQLVGNEESENKEEHVVRSIPSSNSSASESSEENEDVRDSILSAEAKDNIFIVTSKKEDATDHLQNILQLTMYKYGEAMQTFFQHLLDPTSRAADDVYSYMFLCDFFNFFVILIGYSSFGAQQGDGGVSSYLEDNRVPALFLVMLILQFMLIIIDRGIFLRKNILGKIIFQFSQVFLLHLWLFVLFPIMTGSRFNTVLPPQMYYMVKCFYLLLSAYQIRCGYPTRILGNFLCKGYNYVNMFLFKGFMAIPFLFELRTVMDWMWTDTSMTVFDWIKMEDIFAHIFQLKCSRHVEDEYPQPRGERKKLISKYLMGGGILAVIIAVIWFPLVFFSLGNAVGEPNVPYDVTLEIRIGPYEPVYQMSAQSNFIYSFNENEMSQLIKAYQNYKSSITFITNYESSDIAAVQLSTNSANIWSISPPDRERMLEEVQSSRPLSVRLEYKISHKTSKPEDSGVIPDNVEISIPAGTPARNNLLQMLQGKPADPISLTRILPKFFKVTNRGTAKPITQLMDSDYGDSQYRDISLRLLRPENSTDSGKEWWQVHENCTDKNYQNILKNIPYADCKSIILYTFNDKIFPATLNIITGGGIIGLYTTLVFLASRVLRGFFAEQCFKIMFEDMPNVDRVLQLCLDVYLVREAREFALEEDLFAKLVFLFRSPETLIKWTRPKEELDDDEDPEGAD